MAVHRNPERVKQFFVRTPLESPLKWLRMTARLPWRLRHPELHNVYMEELRIEAFLKAVLEPDSNCVDVGPHLGAVLSSMVKLAPRGRHYAFEPVARKATWLQQRFPEVEVRAVAVGDHKGVVDFFEPEGGSAVSTLYTAEHSSRTRVECERLDDVIPPDHRVDLLKIDVIGAEISALEGATRLIERCRPNIIVASGYEIFEAAQSTPDELFDLMTDMGYGIFFFHDAFADTPLTLEQFLAAQRYPYQAFTFAARPLARNGAGS